MNDSRSLEVSVIGCGAIGSALAYLFATLGWKTELIGRNKVQMGHTVVSLRDGSRAQVQSDRSPSQTRRLWLVATKATDLKEAIDNHCDQFSAGDAMLLVANGHWLTEAKLWCADFLNKIEVYVGVTTLAVRPQKDGSYLLLNPDSGVVIYAPLAVTNQSALVELGDCKSFVFVNELRTAMTKKWLANCVINTLAAAYNLDSNREVLKHKDFAQLFEDAYQLSVASWGSWSLQTKEELLQDLVTLVVETGENLNSMVRDRRLGRRMELKYIGGIVERYPHLDVPTLRRLVAILKSFPNDM